MSARGRDRAAVRAALRLLRETAPRERGAADDVVVLGRLLSEQARSAPSGARSAGCLVPLGGGRVGVGRVAGRVDPLRRVPLSHVTYALRFGVGLVPHRRLGCVHGSAGCVAPDHLRPDVRLRRHADESLVDFAVDSLLGDVFGGLELCTARECRRRIPSTAFRSLAWALVAAAERGDGVGTVDAAHRLAHVGARHASRGPADSWPMDADGFVAFEQALAPRVGASTEARALAVPALVAAVRDGAVLPREATRAGDFGPAPLALVLAGKGRPVRFDGHVERGNG